MKPNRLIKLGLILILALTIFLRFYNIGGLPHFTYDQARDALFIKRIIVEHKFRLIGTQSSIPGLYTPPFYYYLMTPFLWLFGLNPVGLDYATALFGTATAVLLYMVLLKLGCGKIISLGITALFAFQPEIVFQSRYAWNPNTTPFFMLLSTYFLVKILKDDNKPLWYLILFFSLGAMINLHYSGAVFSLAMVFLLLLNRKSINKRYFILGVAVLFLLLSPLLIFDLRHDFVNARGLLNYLLYNPRNEMPAPPFFPGLFEKYRFLFGLVLPKGIGTLLLNIVSAVSFFGFIIMAVLKKNRFLNYLLFLFFLSLLGASFYQRGFYLFYLTFLYPLPFLILGKSIALVNKKTISRLLYLFLIVTIVINFIFSYKMISGSNVTLEKQLDRVSAFLSEKVEPPFNLASVYRGSDRFGHNAVDYRYFLETLYGKKALDWEPLDYQNSSNLYLISEVGEIEPLKKDIWEVLMFNPKEISDTWKIDDIYIYHLVK